jgi:hypothetical protein
MELQKLKKILKQIAKPVKFDLFKEVGYNEEELALMKYLYIDRIDQGWVSDELGISLATLTNWHNSCMKQLRSFFNYEKYKMENNQDNSFKKYFEDVA